MYRIFSNAFEAYEFYEYLKSNPVQYSVYQPKQIGDVWEVEYREWRLD